MNADNLNASSELLSGLNEKTNQVYMKIVENETEINKQRDVLMKLDEDLNYMETCNENHKTSQSYMLERMQKESSLVKENTMTLTECQMKMDQFEKEEGVIRYEVDGLRVSSEDLFNRKTQMQIENSTLEQHMKILLSTNQQLSCELEGFVQTDLEVQAFLNKKEKVKTIREKAELELNSIFAES